MTDKERIALISTVYNTVLNHTETFHGRIGGDLAYLCGAIAETLQPLKCEFSEHSGIVRILRNHFAPEHKVWSFIDIQPTKVVTVHG